MRYIVATDGACKGNPGPGTWAFVVFDPRTKKMLGHKKGNKATTTNNEMEMRAILEALDWSNRNKLEIEILTDSNYVLQGLTSWMTGWKRRGWKTASGSSVANLGLWKELDNAYNPDLQQLTKVKGHSGNPYNDAADMYCNEEYLNAFI